MVMTKKKPISKKSSMPKKTISQKPSKLLKKPAPKKTAASPKKAAPQKSKGSKTPNKNSKTPAKASNPIKKAVSKKTKAVLPTKIMRERGALQQTFITPPVRNKDQKLSPFLAKQRQRLLQLKDTLLDSMSGVARGNLRSGCDASAFGMHQADAGSDAYDRDFALSILSQEQNSLYEIDEALKRIDDGTYGICEISNKQISRARLEARPFTRYTVECQADLEKRQHVSGARVPVSSLFGLTEEETENEEEDSFNDNPKD